MSEQIGCDVAASNSRARAQAARGTRGGAWTSLAAALALALALAGLCASTAAARGAQGAFTAGPLVDPSAPEVETEPATEVKRTSAVLNATVNPDGLNVSECTFEYGTSPESLESKTQCAYLPGSGDSGVPVYAEPEDLEESTTYYYRIKAKNSDGAAKGTVQEFTTLPEAPSVLTEPPSELTEHTAKLNGFVNPNGAEVTECFFEWSTKKNLGDAETVACRSLPGSGEREVPVSAEIEGLEKDTPYYYRLVAINSYGATYGHRELFETPPSAPIVATEGATEVKRSGGMASATLTGSVNPNGKAITRCEFVYGPTKAHSGGSVSCTKLPPAGEQPVRVKAEVSGLEEHKTYYFELVAASEAGEGLGGNNTLSTPPNAPKDYTGFAEDVTASTATLKGKVTPYGAPTECAFEYGTTRLFGKEAECEDQPGSGEEPVFVKADVHGLTPATTYYVRLRAKNEWGQAYGGVSTFVTNKEGLLPEITKVKPDSGPDAGETSVTIKGTNIEHVVSVTFGLVAAKSFRVTSEGASGEISAVSPAETAGTVNITVTTDTGASKEVKADEFTYEPPTVTGLSPDEGPLTGDQTVTVTGTGFSTESGQTTFEFGAQKATEVECRSMTTCTLKTPAGTKKGKTKVYATVNGKRSKKPAAYYYEG